MSSGQGELYFAQDNLRDQVIAEWIKIFGILAGIGLTPLLLDMAKIPEWLAWITRQFWLPGLTAGLLTILVGVIYSLRQTASIRRRWAEANPPRMLETGKISPRDIRIQVQSDPLAQYSGPSEVMLLLDYLRLGYAYSEAVTATNLSWLQNILSQPEMEIQPAAIEYIRRQGITALREAKHPTLKQFLEEITQDSQTRLDWEEKKHLESIRGLLSSTSKALQEPGWEVGEALRWMVEQPGYLKMLKKDYESDKLKQQNVAVTAVIKQIHADHIRVHALAQRDEPDTPVQTGEAVYVFWQTPTLTIAIGILILMPALIAFWVQQAQLKNPGLIQLYFSSPVIFLWIAIEGLFLFRQTLPREAWQLAAVLKSGLQIAAAIVLWGYLGSFFGLEGLAWQFWLAAGLAAAGALLGSLAVWLQPRSKTDTGSMSVQSSPGAESASAPLADEQEARAITAARFQVFRGKKRQYYFRLLGSQGAILLASEGYKTRAGCINGILSVKKNASLDARFEQRKAVNDEHYFVLQAGNLQVIGTSETFSNPVDLENDLRNVQELAPQADIEDLTS